IPGRWLEVYADGDKKKRSLGYIFDLHAKLIKMRHKKFYDLLGKTVKLSKEAYVYKYPGYDIATDEVISKLTPDARHYKIVNFEPFSTLLEFYKEYKGNFLLLEIGPHQYGWIHDAFLEVVH
ncbi:MAG: hypothetical protein D6767_01635, partial [Candidatus Hydrogenedentota bacterium]